MNTIDKLIEELCPDGVEYVELGKVCAYSDSKIDGKSLNSTTFVGVDNLLPNKGGKADATYSPNTERLTKYEHGDVILGNIRPYLKKIWLADSTGGCSGDVLALRINQRCQSTLVPEFLYYLLSSDAFFDYNTQHAKGAKMPRGNKEAIMRFPIPLPPLEIQREIVKILDTFSQLEAELEAELEARRLQYRHYRDELLSFGDEVEWRTIVELCDVERGRVISKDYLHEHPGSYPVYSSQTENEGIFGRIDSYDYDCESVTWTTDGANAGSVFYHKGERFSITNVCGIMRVKVDVIISRFLFHWLSYCAKEHVSSGMGNPKLMSAALKSIEVPIPPLAEQQRIVDILDTFDALVNDLSSGLPAEIAARRQQYEHYRDRLLTFKEKGRGLPVV